MRRLITVAITELLFLALGQSQMISPVFAACCAVLLGVFFLVTAPSISARIFHLFKVRTTMSQIITMSVIGGLSGLFVFGGGYWIQEWLAAVAKEREAKLLAEEKQALSPKLNIKLFLFPVNAPSP